MATPKRFQSLVQLLQQEGRVFEVPSNLSKLPSWCHSEYLESPKAVRLEAWLVEAVFGTDGEHIPHVECVTHTLLRVNQWDPEGEAEILIFGRPCYQQDVLEMINHLADHFHQQKKALAQEVKNQQSPLEVHEASTQQSPKVLGAATPPPSSCEVPGAATPPPPPVEAPGAATQPPPPEEVPESGSHKFPEVVPEVGTQHSPAEVHETGTQQSLDLVQDARIQGPPGATWDLVTRL